MKLSSFFILAKVCIAFFYKVSTAESLKEEEVELSTNTNMIKPLLESYHGRAVSFEANDASQATDFAAIHVHDASMKRKLDGSVTGLICSDDTSWRWEGKRSSKHCGHVYFSPSRHCSKVSAEGVPASEACPIACGDLRTKTCDIPECSDESWFFWWPKRGGKWKVCNDYLHQHVKSRCRNLGVTGLGNDPKFFAYEYCSRCNVCVPPTSPTLNPTSSPTTSPTSSPTSSPTKGPTSSPTSSPTESPTPNPSTSPSPPPSPSPTSNPTEDSYDKFATSVLLKDAVSDYCADPDAWKTNSKYAKYGPIEKWDVSSIDDMSRVFFYGKYNCNPNIADWDVSGVTDFDYMFREASSFNQDIGGWDVSNGRYFYNTFLGASSFNQDIGGWDVSKGQSFGYMFYSASSFNQDIGGWDVSKGTIFRYMFTSASSFNQDIGGWDVSKGTDYYAMFYMASLFNQDLCDWDIDDSAFTNGFCEGAISCGDSCSF